MKLWSCNARCPIKCSRLSRPARKRISALSSDQFPFEKSRWAGNPDTAKSWLEILERTGHENVRVRLAQHDTGSASAISIGGEGITRGFAEEWIAWHDRRKSER